MSPQSDSPHLGRRDFLKAAGAMTAGAAIGAQLGTLPGTVTHGAVPQVTAPTRAVQPFRLSQVTLGEGLFREKRDRMLNYARNYGGDTDVFAGPDRMLRNFRATAGIDTRGAQPPGSWDNATGYLRGHYCGHFMSLLAQAYAGSGDEDQSTAAALSMLARTPDEEAIAAHLYPRPEVPLGLLPFVAERGYGFFGGRLARAIGHPVTDEFRVGKELCAATISVAPQLPGVRLTGTFDGAAAPTWLIVVDRAGQVRGLAARARAGDGIVGYASLGALGGTLYGIQEDTLCRAASMRASS